MSLITRCPACETLFKVVPDQLRISEGWVRCGHCDEVFDASLHLQTLQPTGSASTSPAALTALPDAPPPAPPGEVASGASPDAFDLDVNLDSILPADEWPAANDAAAEVVDLVLERPDPAALSTDPAEVPVQDAFENDLKPAPVLELDDAPEPSDASFLRTKPKPAPSRAKRVGMGAAFLLLVLVLLGQVAMHERDRLVALQPELKPWAQTICQALNCKLSALRHIESILIENSSFSSLNGNAYRLNLTLKNQSGMSVAIPAVELTLTDSLDQPVMRRVLTADEFQGPLESLAAAGELAVALTVTVTASAGPGRVTGYRLLAFYP
jgi:predicted Zn finger-like uncharacterized protein